MKSTTQKIEETFQKKRVADVRSGDTVRVHQKIKEGNKERVQIFEGLVIRTKRKKSLTSSITVRRIASGVGVEKSFLLHSPLIEKIDVVKRSDVNRNYLSYMRNRSGKSARLDSVEFDRDQANVQESEMLIGPADVETEEQDEKADAKSEEADEPAVKEEPVAETPATDTEATEEKA